MTIATAVTRNKGSPCGSRLRGLCSSPAAIYESSVTEGAKDGAKQMRYHQLCEKRNLNIWTQMRHEIIKKEMHAC